MIKVIEHIFLNLENLHNFPNDLLFLPKRRKTEPAEMLVANLHDIIEYVIRMINLNQAVNQQLVFKKVHRVIKFNQKSRLKPYIDTITKLRKKAKMISKKFL